MNNRLRLSILASIFVLFFMAARPARAALGRIECNSMRSAILRRSVRYCAILPPSYDTEKTRRFAVLYFLHGLGENEQMLVSSGAWNLIEDLWEGHQLGEFLIVAPAGDTSFYINSRDGRVRYEDFFLHEFLPFIERTYRIQRGRRSRGIGGISMGGYGALHLAFAHPEWFASVSTNSAALLEKLPDVKFSTQSPPAFFRALSPFGTPFDPAYWRRNNPLQLARTANLAGLKIYFDCGTEDDYGFEAGARALDEILKSRGVPHEFHLYPGGHDWQYFAAHLPAALQFDSRAFGLRPSK